MHQAFGRKEEA